MNFRYIDKVRMHALYNQIEPDILASLNLSDFGRRLDEETNSKKSIRKKSSESARGEELVCQASQTATEKGFRPRRY